MLVKAIIAIVSQISLWLQKVALYQFLTFRISMKILFGALIGKSSIDVTIERGTWDYLAEDFQVLICKKIKSRGFRCEVSEYMWHVAIEVFF